MASCGRHFEQHSAGRFCKPLSWMPFVASSCHSAWRAFTHCTHLLPLTERSSLSVVLARAGCSDLTLRTVMHFCTGLSRRSPTSSASITQRSASEPIRVVWCCCRRAVMSHCLPAVRSVMLSELTKHPLICCSFIDPLVSWSWLAPLLCVKYMLSNIVILVVLSRLRAGTLHWQRAVPAHSLCSTSTCACQLHM